MENIILVVLSIIYLAMVANLKKWTTLLSLNEKKHISKEFIRNPQNYYIGNLALAILIIILAYPYYAVLYSVFLLFILWFVGSQIGRRMGYSEYRRIIKAIAMHSNNKKIKQELLIHANKTNRELCILVQEYRSAKK